MTTTVPALAQDIGLARQADYFLMKDQLTEDEPGLLHRVRKFAETEVLPLGLDLATKVGQDLVVLRHHRLLAVRMRLVPTSRLIYQARPRPASRSPVRRTKQLIRRRAGRTGLAPRAGGKSRCRGAAALAACRGCAPRSSGSSARGLTHNGTVTGVSGPSAAWLPPHDGSDVGRSRSSHSAARRTSIFPVLAPRSSPMNASTACSMPCTTVSSDRSEPSRSHPAACVTYSSKRS